VFIDIDGNVIIEPQYLSVFDFSDGLAAAYSKGKCGYINTKGKIVIHYILILGVHFLKD